MCGYVHGLQGAWHSSPLHKKGVHGAYGGCLSLSCQPYVWACGWPAWSLALASFAQEGRAWRRPCMRACLRLQAVQYGCRFCASAHARHRVRAAQCYTAGIGELCALLALQHCRLTSHVDAPMGTHGKSVALPWEAASWWWVLLMNTVLGHHRGQFPLDRLKHMCNGGLPGSLHKRRSMHCTSSL